VHRCERPALERPVRHFLWESFAKGIEWLCLNPMNQEEYRDGLNAFQGTGFDDIIVMVSIPAVISEAAAYLSGWRHEYLCRSQSRRAGCLEPERYHIPPDAGHRAHWLYHPGLAPMLHQAETGERPQPDCSGGRLLSAARDGLFALRMPLFRESGHLPADRGFSFDFLAELKEKLPNVWGKSQEWASGRSRPRGISSIHAAQGEGIKRQASGDQEVPGFTLP
jgi:hypothetical protein